MNPLFAAPLLEIGKTLLDRFGPEDKNERMRVDAEFMSMVFNGDLKRVIAQLEINAKEAAHPSLFVAGGRPLFLWIGGFAFAYSTIVQPILTWYARVKGWPEPPDVNSELLWVVVTGLLGIGGMRSYDKTKGTAK